jgi:hypothetical protein
MQTSTGARLEWIDTGELVHGIILRRDSRAGALWRAWLRAF